MKIRELLKQNTKENLQAIASNMKIKKYYKYNKKELVDCIAEELLKPDVMFYRLSILDADLDKMFNKSLEGYLLTNDNEYLVATIICDLSYGDVQQDRLYLCEDAFEVWKTIDHKKFVEYSKKATWVYKCQNWIVRLYAVAEETIFLKLVNLKKSLHMEMNELKEIFNHFPYDILDLYNLGQVFVTEKCLNEKEFKILLTEQANKDYYIPTVSQIEKLHLNGILDENEAYKEMETFLNNKLKIDKMISKMIICLLWDWLSQEEDINDNLQKFLELIGHTANYEDDIREILDLYMNCANNTRTIFNRGYTPNELAEKYKSNYKGLPTITAGSSHAAELLRQASPEIEKMGFKVDLNSNADSITYRDDTNENSDTMRFIHTKVYPNDPCPCGSGKKYKKCCGMKNL